MDPPRGNLIDNVTYDDARFVTEHGQYATIKLCMQSRVVSGNCFRERKIICLTLKILRAHCTVQKQNDDKSFTNTVNTYKQRERLVRERKDCIYLKNVQGFSVEPSIGKDTMKNINKILSMGVPIALNTILYVHK